VRVIRVQAGANARYGVIVDDMVYALRGAEPWDSPLEPGDKIGPLRQIELLAPCQPSKIVCLGRNYVAHAKEHGADVPKAPLIFLKPSTAVIAPGAAIVLPAQSKQVEHESELAVVIGRRARNVARDDASRYIFGYTCGNDVTARDLQNSDGQWTRSKSFDTFCPLGPWIETELNIADLEVTCRVNGETRQHGRTSELVFDIPHLVSHISGIMTLLPGDVIMSGTPAGVSPIHAGDSVEVEIEGIGVLRNPVVA
jgi:2-keto-4-pentenoate hydratase/2-oxohepta-3-ene-1,7-dioic acid hydratase in catechol pathway